MNNGPRRKRRGPFILVILCALGDFVVNPAGKIYHKATKSTKHHQVPPYSTLSFAMPSIAPARTFTRYIPGTSPAVLIVPDPLPVSRS